MPRPLFDLNPPLSPDGGGVWWSYIIILIQYHNTNLYTELAPYPSNTLSREPGSWYLIWLLFSGMRRKSMWHSLKRNVAVFQTCSLLGTDVWFPKTFSLLEHAFKQQSKFMGEFFEISNSHQSWLFKYLLKSTFIRALEKFYH